MTAGRDRHAFPRLSRRAALQCGAAAIPSVYLGQQVAYAQDSDRRPIEIKVGATTLSGIFRPAIDARALIFCIHGGSYTSRYFDFKSQRGETLFDLAPQFGYSVLAIDRPGYGAAEKLMVSFDEQAALLTEAVDKARSQFAGNTKGVLLVGHSIGAMLAMLMAARSKAGLLGLDLNGAGLEFRGDAKEGLKKYVSMANPPREPNKAARLNRMFGPAGTFKPEAAEEDFAAAPLSQPGEIREAIGWEQRVSEVAPKIAVPVNFSLSDLDALWKSDATIVERCARLFTRSPLVEARIQWRAGHSVHLHEAARAYNLRTIAFLDDCMRVKGA
jgi:pimeloyl-ACP methyl ester carboxylesterase